MTNVFKMDYDKRLYDGCTLNQEELKNNLLTVAHP